MSSSTVASSSRASSRWCGVSFARRPSSSSSFCRASSRRWSARWQSPVWRVGDHEVGEAVDVAAGFEDGLRA